MIFGKRFEKENIDQMVRYMGLDESPVTLMKYSELKNSSNPNLRKLYSDEFVGDDLWIDWQYRNDEGNIHLKAFKKFFPILYEYNKQITFRSDL